MLWDVSRLRSIAGLCIAAGCASTPNRAGASADLAVAPLIVVGDLPRSLQFYEHVMGASRIAAGDSYARLALGVGELHLATHSDPTPDKPGITLAAPDPTSSIVHGEIVLGVRDCRAIYARLVARGAKFLSPPTTPPWGHELRAFLRDPDGHLIEISEVVP